MRDITAITVATASLQALLPGDIPLGALTAANWAAAFVTLILVFSWQGQGASNGHRGNTRAHR